MKKAFTMIELIFVIVILGILAAVALPKFMGVAKQSHEANLKSFVGTLNRTVGPTLWSTSIANGNNGNIRFLEGGNLYYTDSAADPTHSPLLKYVDVPKEVREMNLSKCDTVSAWKIVGYANQDAAGGNYFIACLGGNANQSPHFVLYRQSAPSTEIGSSHLGDANDTAYDAQPAKYGNDAEEGYLISE